LKTLKGFFTATFYSVDEYLSDECATGKMGDDEKRIRGEREIP
jgi:hypothetical protein